MLHPQQGAHNLHCPHEASTAHLREYKSGGGTTASYIYINHVWVAIARRGWSTTTALERGLSVTHARISAGIGRACARIRRIHARIRRTHARTRRGCWKTARRGKFEVCEAMDPSNVDRNSGKGVFLSTVVARVKNDRMRLRRILDGELASS